MCFVLVNCVQADVQSETVALFRMVELCQSGPWQVQDERREQARLTSARIPRHASDQCPVHAFTVDSRMH